MRIAFILIGLFLAPAVLEADTNWINNPGFERPSPTNAALPWGWSIADKTYAWARDGHTGEKGVRFVVEGDSRAVHPVIGNDLAPNGLYRFSFWYKTECLKHSETAVDIRAGQLSFTYPTSTEWAEARLFFLGKEHKQYLVAQVNGFEGAPRYKKDSNGQYLRAGNDRKIAENPLKIVVTLDDFEMRMVDQQDFAGNLLQNGDFENGNQTGLPAGWVHSEGNGTVGLDRESAGSGQRCLRVVPVTFNFDTVRSGRFPVRAGALYALSLWLKSDKITAEVRLNIQSDGMASKEPLMGEKRTLLGEKKIAVSPEWERHEFLFEAPGAEDRDYRGEVFPAYLQIRCRSKIEGNAIRIDNARVSVE